MAWPICWVNIALPSWVSMPSIGPAIACASAGSAEPIAFTTLSATGSTSRCHTGMLASTHSARLQAAIWLVPGGKLGGGVEPVLGELADVGEPGPVARVGRPVRLLRHDLAGQVAGELPVDRALVRGEHPLELTEHRLQP